jgi:hypothetical protein
MLIKRGKRCSNPGDTTMAKKRNFIPRERPTDDPLAVTAYQNLKKRQGYIGFKSTYADLVTSIEGESAPLNESSPDPDDRPEIQPAIPEKVIKREPESSVAKSKNSGCVWGDWMAEFLSAWSIFLRNYERELRKLGISKNPDLLLGEGVRSLILQWDAFRELLATSYRLKKADVPNKLDFMIELIDMFYDEAGRVSIVMDGSNPDERNLSYDDEDSPSYDYEFLEPDQFKIGYDKILKSCERMTSILDCVVYLLSKNSLGHTPKLDQLVNEWVCKTSRFSDLKPYFLCIIDVVRQSESALKLSQIKEKIETQYKVVPKNKDQISEILKTLKQKSLLEIKSGGRTYLISDSVKKQFEAELETNQIKLPKKLT